LAESVPYSFSELTKEIAILHRVLDIHEHAHQLIAVHLSSILPLAFYPLSFRGDSAKPAPKFNDRVRDKIVWHRTAVVKPKRQKNLEWSA